MQVVPSQLSFFFSLSKKDPIANESCKEQNKDFLPESDEGSDASLSTDLVCDQGMEEKLHEQSSKEDFVKSRK